VEVSKKSFFEKKVFTHAKTDTSTRMRESIDVLLFNRCEFIKISFLSRTNRFFFVFTVKSNYSIKFHWVISVDRTLAHLSMRSPLIPIQNAPKFRHRAKRGFKSIGIISLLIQTSKARTSRTNYLELAHSLSLHQLQTRFRIVWR